MTKTTMPTQAVIDANCRAKMILKVLKGECTVTEAAADLGISRNSYYDWEKRGFAGMVEGLTEKKPGRPSLPEEVAENRRLKEFIKFQEKKLEKAKNAELLARRACEIKIRYNEGKIQKKTEL